MPDITRTEIWISVWANISAARSPSNTLSIVFGVGVSSVSMNIFLLDWGVRGGCWEESWETAGGDAVGLDDEGSLVESVVSFSSSS